MFHRAFRHLLIADQETRGANNYVLEDRAADEFQQRVDDIIEVGVLDAATSVQGDGDGAAFYSYFVTIGIRQSTD
ncbi:hypothetical protein C8F04DRAFT_1248638 [Mycena alexandri]|uniref:Uncharacterized protein n=1 Tax=Mycena alexandri TaxID=1745969 RepID=A0AAD6TH04_9AGAR|nr:hypothetical protein C8F04DRAFT_1248638 [Mycena alexandri]